MLLFTSGSARAQVWNPNGVYGNWTSLAMTADGSKIAGASLIDGIYASTDGGASWTNRGTPDGNHWATLATSSSGGNLVAAFYGGKIYTSADWGGSWFESSASTNGWDCLASSADGAKIVAGTGPGAIYTSKDGGATFTSRLPLNNDYQAVAASTDGQSVIAVAFSGNIYKSADGGESWVTTAAPVAAWAGVAASADGAKVAAIVRGGGIYLSTDSGLTWNASSAPSTNWTAITVSTDGSKLAATVDGGFVYVSADSGSTWQPKTVNNIFTVTKIVTNTVFTILRGTGPNGQIINNQVFKDSFSSTRTVESGTVNLTTILGFKVKGAKVTGKKTALVTPEFGFAFPETNSFFFRPLGTNAVGTNLLGAPMTIPSINITKTFTDVLAIPNSAGSVHANFDDVLTTNLPGLQLTIHCLLDASAIVAPVLQHWSAIASSEDGARVVAAQNGGGIFASANAGVTWVQANAPVTNWTAVASSADGSKWVATVSGGWIYTSTNGGFSWVASTNGLTHQMWAAVASSADGAKLAAAVNDGLIYTSTNGGATWAVSSAPLNFWSAVESSPDGGTLIALAQNGPAYKSSDGGLTWRTVSSPNGYWRSVASSTDGNTLLAARDSYLYQSTNAGADWRQLNTVLKTNAIISESLVGSLISTNAANHKLSTNVFSVILGSTNVISGNAVHLSTTFGVETAGGNLTGTNVAAIGSDLGVRLGGGDVFSYGRVNTILLGTNVLGSGTVFPSTNTFETVENDFGFSYPNNLVITNTFKVLNTNFSAVLPFTAAGVKMMLTNTLQVSVAVLNLPQTWSAVASSGDGVKLVGAVSGGYIYTSSDSGISWSPTTAPSADWMSIASSADGRTLVALSHSGLLYYSADAGVSWVGTNVPPSLSGFSSVVCSADGGELMEAGYSGLIYSSQVAVSPAVALSLNISAVNGNVVVTWPAGWTNCTLQQKAGMSGNTPWVDLPVTPVVTNGLNQVTVPMGTVQSLYRLRK